MGELRTLASAWLRAPRPLNAELEQFGWLLEELRVSLFAQELKTPVPVSAKRLAKMWQSIHR
jgi:ATP-dependent helicase HrpA